MVTRIDDLNLSHSIPKEELWRVQDLRCKQADGLGAVAVSLARISRPILAQQMWKVRNDKKKNK